MVAKKKSVAKKKAVARGASPKKKSTERKASLSKPEAVEKIDRYVAGIRDWRGEVLAAVRRAVLSADAGMTEDWKWMGTPTWYCDGLVCIANAHKGKVKVTFAHGARIADADGLFNAGLEGNARRAIDFLEGERVNEAKLRRLVKKAVEWNRAGRK